MSKNLYIIGGCNGAGKTTNGIRNLFGIFMKEVDSWMIYDNSRNPRTLVARGGKSVVTEVVLGNTYNKIKEYVR